MTRTAKLICGGLTAPTVLALSLALVAQPSGGVVFRDRQSNMVVRQLDSWLATRVSDQIIRFVGAGKPFIGTWKDQSLTVTALKLEGEASRQGNGAFRLRTATFSGPLTASVVGAGPDAETVNLACNRIQWQADGNRSRAQLTGAVRVTSRNSAGRLITLEGPSAVLTLPGLGERTSFPLERAEVAGPVVVTFLNPGTTRDGKDATVALKATAGRLIYDDTAKRLEFSGGVTLEGEDAVVAAVTTATRAVVTLDANRQPLEVELMGDPGQSAFREAKPR